MVLFFSRTLRYFHPRTDVVRRKSSTLNNDYFNFRLVVVCFVVGTRSCSNGSAFMSTLCPYGHTLSGVVQNKQFFLNSGNVDSNALYVYIVSK